MEIIKKDSISKEKWCVIIPTFNNDKTLESVLHKTLNISKNIIVINDGSTDNTTNILDNFKDRVKVINHSVNQGKGKSLRNAFKYAIEKKFEYAITIDSDGQHYPEDINLFIKSLSKYTDSIIIGARDMMQDGIPKKSSLGNKFSNFWFLVETGVSLSDTQTGFRLYPLNKMQEMFFFSTRFEFEIEIIVRMAWKKIPIREIPVRVKYGESRVSHFRPFKDFMRISLLNTILVTLSLFYHIPLRIIYSLFNNEKIKEFFSQEGSLLQKSISIGLGAFMSAFPIWGFQMVTAIFLSYIFKLNKIIVLLFANLSIPPLLPFILFGSYYIGHIIIGGEELVFSKEIDFNYIKGVLKQYIIGSIIFSIILGLVFFLFSYLIMSVSNRGITQK